jgi:hypothetical protein
MPIYEFYCPAHHRIHSFFARSLALAGQTPRCPDGGKAALVKTPSTFAVTGRHRGDGESGAEENDPFAGLDDAAMARLAGEFERELGGNAEPDGRAMGRMMRRMAEIAGAPLARPMAEMVGRLEKGEDPDALEAEFGEAIGGDGAEWFEGVRKTLRERPPTRDTKLYEMSDYLASPRPHGSRRRATGRKPIKK